jgi:hypothetical protein
MWLKNVIDELHESGWCVGQSERYDQPLIQTKIGFEFFFSYISRFHAHLMIPRSQIHHCEEIGPL